MCQIFCCSIIQGVIFNYHQRNVRSRVSVSNFQVSVSVFMTSLGLVSKFEPGLGLGGYGPDYITAMEPGQWTPAPLSAHPSIECRCTAPQIDAPICTHRTTTHQFTILTTTYVRRIGRITNGIRSGRTTLQDSTFSSPTPAPTPE